MNIEKMHIPLAVCCMCEGAHRDEDCPRIKEQTPVNEETMTSLAQKSLPISPIEDMRIRKLSSIALRLQHIFPEEEAYISDVTDRFLGTLSQTLSKSQEELPQHGLPQLPDYVLTSTEQFYRLKAEQQLRGCFALAVKKTVYGFLTDLDELHTRVTREKRDVISPERKQSLRTISVDVKNEVVSVPYQVSGSVKNKPAFNSEDKEYVHFDRHVLDEWKLAIISTIPHDERTKAQRKILDDASAQGRVISRIPFMKLVGVVKANPILGIDLKTRFENDVVNRERYVERKIRETTAMIAAVLKDYNGEPLLDVCTGTGDLATILKTSGYPVTGVDINAHYLKLGRVYHYLMGKKQPKHHEIYLKEADVLKEGVPLPSAQVWVAKHPCAPHFALPDAIIQRFADDLVAERLYLLTCCASKSKGACPHQYIGPGFKEKN